MRSNSTNLQKKIVTAFKKQTFDYMNISRKCKFICSNCVIVACFQSKFNKYKYLQKLNILETKKHFKYAHFQNLVIYTTIPTKMTKEYLQKKLLMAYDVHSNFTNLQNKKQK